MHTAVTCPVWTVDTDTGAFLDANPPALEIFGYSREEILRLRIFDMIDQSEQLRFSSAWISWRENWGDGGTWTGLMKNGTRFSMTLRFHGTQLGQNLAFIIFPTSVEQHPTLRLTKVMRTQPAWSKLSQKYVR